MFIRDILSLTQDDAAGGLQSLRATDTLPAQPCTLAGLDGVLMNRAADFTLDGRTAWIFISIKNRLFNRPYIDWFIDMCEEQGLQGRICPVDDPYRYNAMAELARDDLPPEETDKIVRLSSDIRRMVQKAINGKRTSRVEIVAWSDMEAETPSVFRDELREAFDAGTIVRDTMHRHVSSVKPVESERQFERFAEFFICEVPVLMSTYYRDGPTMDIYPGLQPDFFWQIEMGLFAQELPQLTSYIMQRRSMLYLNTTGRPGKKAA